MWNFPYGRPSADMALHLVTAQKSLNFRQLSSFWTVVQGKTITRTCCLAWLWGGTQLHSSGSREERKAEALPCSAKEMNHWTALLELLALNCLYRQRYHRACLRMCAYIYGHSVLHLPLFPYYHIVDWEELLLSKLFYYSWNHFTLLWLGSDLVFRIG